MPHRKQYLVSFECVVGCGICHKPFTCTGNRHYWMRNNVWSHSLNVCGRKKCRAEIQALVTSGVIYTSYPVHLYSE